MSDLRPAPGGGAPEEGWYPDPAYQYAHRYWDGGQWTTYVVADGRTIERELPVPDHAPPLADLPPVAVWTAVGAALVGIGLARGVDSALSGSLLSTLILTQAALWGTLAITLVVMSRRYGTGNLAVDYGIRVRGVDAAGGLAAAISGRLLAAVGAILVIAAFGDEGTTGGGEFDFFDPSDAAFFTFLGFAVIGAPIIEEIFFRGLVQRALEPGLGAAWAVAVQALLFGAAHVRTDADAALNVQILVAISLGGVVLGLAFQLTRRLGTSMIAHALFNLVFAVAAVIERY